MALETLLFSSNKSIVTPFSVARVSHSVVAIGVRLYKCIGLADSIQIRYGLQGHGTTGAAILQFQESETEKGPNQWSLLGNRPEEGSGQ